MGVFLKALSYWTYKAKSPWSKVYKPEDWKTSMIDNSFIKEYFEELLLKTLDKKAIKPSDIFTPMNCNYI
jgi:hypothetical protein